MNITRASDYAIRLLVRLAAMGKETTSEEVAKEIDVPLSHLTKLVHLLARRGYLLTRKGRGGGLKLAKDPKKINLAEVIEAVEGPMMLNKCLFNRKNCRFSLKCKVRECLGVVQRTMRDLLASKTIFEMTA